MDALIELLMIVRDVMPTAKREAYVKALDRLRLEIVQRPTDPKQSKWSDLKSAQQFAILDEAGAEIERVHGWPRLCERLGLTEKTLAQYFSPCHGGTGGSFPRTMAVVGPDGEKSVRRMTIAKVGALRLNAEPTIGAPQRTAKAPPDRDDGHPMASLPPPASGARF